MLKLGMSRQAYILLCAMACITPITLVLTQFSLGVSTPTSLSDGNMFAAIGSFVASVFTYPAGAIGTIASYITVYFGLLTPAEAVLFAAPFYIGAGYLQWFVLVPLYFKVSPNPSFKRDALKRAP